LKQYEKAIADYNKVIELAPNYANAYNYRGLAYYLLEQYEKAIADYNKAIELAPNYAYAYNNRGIAYYALEQYERAIEDYNKAIDLDPNFTIAYDNRGLAYKKAHLTPPPMPVSVIKSKSKVVSYGDLMRHNDEWVGEIIHIIGRVVQVMEDSGDIYGLRVEVTPQKAAHVSSPAGWDDAIFVNYRGERVLCGDIVEIWGEVEGVRTYETVIGSMITVPEITALYVELLGKTEEEWWENEAIKEKIKEHWKKIGIR